MMMNTIGTRNKVNQWMNENNNELIMVMMIKWKKKHWIYGMKNFNTKLMMIKKKNEITDEVSDYQINEIDDNEEEQIDDTIIVNEIV